MLHEATPAATLANAAWHPDPSAFYAELRAKHPGGLFRDETFGGWVACSGAAMATVLAEPRLTVRPPAEPVPRALIGRRSGEVFGALMRMNEGARHASAKAVHRPMIAALQAGATAAVQEVIALGLHPGERALDELLFDAPLACLAALASLPRRQWLATATDTRALVAGWSPEADDRARDAADEASARLLRACGGDPNHVGWFTQACDATAALAGNLVVDALRHGAPSLARVMREDPPVQNTRRWAAAPLEIDGAPMDRGTLVLVLLASAAGDGAPAGFGSGRHACPGERLACTIALGLVHAWLRDHARAMPSANARWCYRRLPNVRIPRFATTPP